MNFDIGLFPPYRCLDSITCTIWRGQVGYVILLYQIIYFFLTKEEIKFQVNFKCGLWASWTSVALSRDYSLTKQSAKVGHFEHVAHRGDSSPLDTFVRQQAQGFWVLWPSYLGIISRVGYVPHTSLNGGICQRNRGNRVIQRTRTHTYLLYIST